MTFQKENFVAVYGSPYDKSSSKVDYRKRFDCCAYPGVLVISLVREDKIVFDVA
jgi:hypothetical protein